MEQNDLVRPTITMLINVDIVDGKVLMFLPALGEWLEIADRIFETPEPYTPTTVCRWERRFRDRKVYYTDEQWSKLTPEKREWEIRCGFRQTWWQLEPGRYAYTSKGHFLIHNFRYVEGDLYADIDR